MLFLPPKFQADKNSELISKIALNQLRIYFVGVERKTNCACHLQIKFRWLIFQILALNFCLYLCFLQYKR